MPNLSITTTAQDVFFGDNRLSSLGFKNGSATGKIYIRYKPHTQAEVTSTSYEISLGVGESIGWTLANDGNGIIGPWRAISDTGGGVTLEIIPIYLGATRGR